MGLLESDPPGTLPPLGMVLAPSGGETDESRLARRVKSKVRAQYGGPKPEEEEPPPRVLGAQVEDGTEVPRGFIQRIYRLSRASSDVQEFQVVLGINGQALRVRVAVSGVSLAVGKQEALKQVLHEMLARSSMAIRDLIEQGLREDLKKYIEDGAMNTDWIEFKW